MLFSLQYSLFIWIDIVFSFFFLSRSMWFIQFNELRDPSLRSKVLCSPTSPRLCFYFHSIHSRISSIFSRFFFYCFTLTLYCYLFWTATWIYLFATNKNIQLRTNKVIQCMCISEWKTSKHCIEHYSHFLSIFIFFVFSCSNCWPTMKWNEYFCTAKSELIGIDLFEFIFEKVFFHIFLNQF